MFDNAFRPQAHVLLAEVYGRAAKPEHGLWILEELQEIIDRTGARFWEAELYRLKGSLLLLQGDGKMQEAEQNLLRAIDIAGRQQAKSWELRATISLARLWQQQGRHNDAYRLLAKVYGWFTEGFDTPDLKAARELLG
jgi:predicted ATPase